jgi:hypothetical protein
MAVLHVKHQRIEWLLRQVAGDQRVGQADPAGEEARAIAEALAEIGGHGHGGSWLGGWASPPGGRR